MKKSRFALMVLFAFSSAGFGQALYTSQSQIGSGAPASAPSDVSSGGEGLSPYFSLPSVDNYNQPVTGTPVYGSTVNTFSSYGNGVPFLSPLAPPVSGIPQTNLSSGGATSGLGATTGYIDPLMSTAVPQSLRSSSLNSSASGGSATSGTATATGAASMSRGATGAGAVGSGGSVLPEDFEEAIPGGMGF
jgi:hypothetical protein